MPRTFDDIIPPSRRKTMPEQFPVQPPNQHVERPVDRPTEQNDGYVPPTPPSLPPRVHIKTGRSFPYGTAIIALLVIAISAGALYAFAGAKVEITPRTQQVTVSGDFVATSGTSDLPYTVVTAEQTAMKAVPAESTETVNDSAQGMITITNSGTAKQTLITNTRFQTPAGLIYRVHTPITVPPAINGTPGSVSAMVYADQTGQQYNSPATTFTVPGLKGSDAFIQVTAKSTGALAGGYSGTRASVSQTTDDQQHSALQSGLNASLQQALVAKIPQGYVLLQGASFTSFTPVPDTATTTTSVEVSVQGSVQGIVFPEGALAKAIAYKSVGTYAGQPVTLNGISSLHVTPTSTAAPSAGDDFNFSMSGQTMVVWTVDSSKIATAVAGKTRDSAQQILNSFPEIDKALLILRPFWANTFPQNPAKVNVTVSAPKTAE